MIFHVTVKDCTVTVRNIPVTSGGRTHVGPKREEEMLIIRERERAGTLVFDMVGRFEFQSSGEFIRALDKVAESPNSHLILNLQEVSFLDSTALGLLHFAHQKLASFGGRVSIVNPHPGAQKLLELANLPSIISIHNLEEEALLVG